MSMLAGRYERTHVYAEVDYARPKYLFQVIADRIETFLRGTSAPRLLDVGGASGALAAYLKHRFPGASVASLDFDPELCRIGAEHLPHIRFIEGDANDMAMLEEAVFDVVTMVGTLSVFDDFVPSLSECLRVCRPGGLVLVVGQFNRHPVDALIRYRYSGDKDWNTGYNLFSCDTVGAFLEAHPAVEDFRFDPFELPFDLAPQQDPIRSWTQEAPGGGRELRNGLNLIIDLQVLEIRRRSVRDPSPELQGE